MHRRYFRHETDATLVLSFGNAEQVETTPTHPFFVVGKGFVEAGQLGIGNVIVTRAGPGARLTSVENKTGRVRVYNFEVADFHTYFVGTCDGGLWVHNQCDEIVLGLDASMKSLAKQTGAAYWKQWIEQGIVHQPMSSRWGRVFSQAVQKASRIHFSLDGIRDIDEAVRLGAKGFTSGNLTNAELHAILSNPALRAKTIFYRAGMQVVLP